MFEYGISRRDLLKIVFKCSHAGLYGSWLELYLVIILSCS